MWITSWDRPGQCKHTDLTDPKLSYYGILDINGNAPWKTDWREWIGRTDSPAGIYGPKKSRLYGVKVKLPFYSLRITEGRDHIYPVLQSPKLTQCLVYIACVLSCLVTSDCFATPQMEVWQAPLSVGFPRQEYWRVLPFPTPGRLPNPGDPTHISWTGRWILYHCTPWEAPGIY